MKTLVLGVTGGIACGKSLVTEQFAACGAVVVSADQLARAAVAPGSEALQQLQDRFGAKIIMATGELDRAGLAALVFGDAEALAALNRITHPAIATLAVNRLQVLRAQGVPLVVYEAPLLFEAGAERRVDQVVVVTLPEMLQLQRLMARDKLSEQAARTRIGAQMPVTEKVARADFVIDNSGTMAETEAQVRCVVAHLHNAGLIR